MALNERVNVNELGRNQEQSWPILRHYNSVCLERLRETIEKLQSGQLVSELRR